MSMANEADQIDVEVALLDVMDIICKYVHGKDLLNMAQVCKSWNTASLCEEQKRYHIQQLRLLYDINKPTSALRLPYLMNNLASVVHAKPNVSLFFREENVEDCLVAVAIDAKEQLPNNVVSVQVDEYLTTEDIQFQSSSIKGHCYLKRGNGDILGIFFPIGKPQIRTYIASLEKMEIIWPPYQIRNPTAYLAKNLARDLRLDECEYPKSTVLLIMTYIQPGFTSTDHYRIVKEFGKIVQQSGKEVTFTNIYCSGFVVGTCRAESEGKRENLLKPCMALRICGRTVESWSTFIHYRARRCDIKFKLQALKERVNKNKRYYMGLMCMPNCADLRCSHIEHPCGDSRRMMHSLKRTFPYIRFTGFFINFTKLHTNPPEYCRFPDALNGNETYNLDIWDRPYLYVSIIIISYD